MNKPKVDNVNSISETSTVCPLCKSDNAIITDPKSGEVRKKKPVVNIK